MTRNDLLNILWRATQAEIGVAFATSNPDELRKKLNNLRTQERRNYAKGECPFDNLKFKISPTDPSGELWIVQKGALKDASQEPSSPGAQAGPIV